MGDEKKTTRPTDDDRYESWAEKLERLLDRKIGPKR